MSFCVLPWLHLATHPHGGVSLCCRVDFNEGRGMAYNKIYSEKNFLNLNKNSVNEIFNSDSFKEARLQMLKGEWPKACLGCHNEESQGLKSKRLRENEYFSLTSEEAQKRTSANGEVQPQFEYLELRLGNLCNLKCRTCNPFSSRKWREDYNKLEEALPFVRRFDREAQFNWAEDENFWNDVLKASDKVKLLFINGGEPTLIKQHWAYLEKLVLDGKSKEIEIKYNINMTYLPDNAFQIWKNFKSVFVGASVDDLAERNSYLRHGAEWKVIEQNLEKLKQNQVPMAIEQTVSAMNVYYIDEVEKYCLKKGYGFGLNFVYDPEYLSIAIIPKSLKNEIINKLKKSGLSDRWLNHVIGNMNQEVNDQEKLWRQFFIYTNQLDQIRKENFEKTFNEYSALIHFSKEKPILENHQEPSC